VDRRTALAREGLSTRVGVGSRRRPAETDLGLGLGFSLEEERGVTFREELEMGLGLGLGFGRSLTGGDGSRVLVGFEAMILPPPPPRSLSLAEIIDKLLGFSLGSRRNSQRKGKVLAEGLPGKERDRDRFEIRILDFVRLHPKIWIRSLMPRGLFLRFVPKEHLRFGPHSTLSVTLLFM
jgi:hypothetical protein